MTAVSLRLRRSHASCTASSASFVEPSIRYATAFRRVRFSSKLLAKLSSTFQFISPVTVSGRGPS